MSNVITAIFTLESEAYQAFSELRQAPTGKDYAAIEVALLTREGDAIKLIDGFDRGTYTTDDTASGFLVGTLAGILGGPLGMLLGGSMGGFVGSVVDLNDAVSANSLIETTAAKLYDGETALIALVDEGEPAFDAALEAFDTTIIRYDAQAVADEVDRAIEAMDEMQNLAREQLRSERKAKLSARYHESIASLKARFDALVARNDEALGSLQDKIEDHGDRLDARMDQVDEALGAKVDELAGKEGALEDAIARADTRLDTAAGTLGLE